MYRIYMYEYNQNTNQLEYNPILIYDDESSNLSYKLISPTLTLEDNRAGSLAFTMTAGNAGYDKISIMKTTVVVRRRVINPAPLDDEWETIWEGRAIQESIDFFNQRSVTCEGALAYLNDMYVLQWNTLRQLPPTEKMYGRDIARYNDKSIQYKAIFKYLLRYINLDLRAVEYTPNTRFTEMKRTYDRRIYVNDSLISKYYGDEILDFSSSCQSIFSYICESITNRHGGHVKLVKRSPIIADDAENMDYDPIDGQASGKKGLYIMYTEEYYSPEISEDTTKAYSVGEHVIQNDKVYRFIQAHEEGTPFDLSEVEEIPDVKVLKIEFAKNLVSLTKEINCSESATAVLVIGGSYELGWLAQSFNVRDGYNSLDQSEQNHNQWKKTNKNGVSMVNHQLNEDILSLYPMVPGFAITPVRENPSLLSGEAKPLRFPDESEARVIHHLYYVVNVKSAIKYGFIAAMLNSNETIIKKNPKPGESQYDYTASVRLYQAGVEYLKEHDPDRYSINITALDFNFVDPEIPYANIGDIFYVDSQIHGLDDSLYFILTKMTIPLDSPESTTFTLNRTVNKDLSTFIK